MIKAPARGRGHLADVLAGVSVALVLIPQSIAYADIAGMPPARGLYAAALPPLLAAFFASSPYLQTGPVAITSLLTFGALSAHAPPGSDEYVALGLVLAAVVGIVRIAIGLLRGGAVAYLMSQPMLMGFAPAAALLIAASQLPQALGAEGGGDSILGEAFTALTETGTWEAAAIAMACGTVLVVLGGRRLHPLFPGVLVMVAAGGVYSELAGYSGATVGEIPAELPPVSFDLLWGDLPSLALSGVIIALVGFSEAASIARVFARRERLTWDPDREFVSQGIANVAAGVSGGFPVGGSFSRSSLNHLAGARTRASGAVTGISVLAFLPFAGVLEPLPRAVLSGIIIAAVVGLMRPGPPLRLWQASRPQFAIAWATFGLTLAFSPHVEYAVVAGVGLSIAVHLWRQLSVELEPWATGDTLHVLPRGVLWFGNAPSLEDRLVRLLAQHPDATHVVVHLGGLGRLDTTGALALRGFLGRARDAGVTVDLHDVPAHQRRLTESVVELEREPFD
jgi:SulP family sulfate permease